MDKSKKKIVIIIGVIAALIVAFLIYWKATEHDRYIKGQMESVLEDISECRSGESSYIYFWFGSSALEDPAFVDFLSAQASEMFGNSEYNLLEKFLSALESDDAYIDEIRDVVTTQYESVSDLEVALKIKDELEYLDYYNSNLELNRNSGLIASYIEANGIEEITTTPGTGFYANEKDSSSSHRVGLSTSPLYDAEEIIHKGDFKIDHEYGVKLNSYYEETSYSRTAYYFRDNYLSFSPTEGECLYSGDYLFCFSSNGTLIGFETIDKK